MLLDGKTAVIHGAGGPIGGAMARAFAREGARVYLTGRTRANLEAVAAGIHDQGGAVEIAELDALEEAAVNHYIDTIVSTAGALDISVNVIGYGDVQQPLMEISADDFTHPIATAMRAQFLTTRAAAKHMIRQGSGVILHFGGDGPQTEPGLGGFKVALDALEGLRRQWAVELGPHGIRVLTLKTGGIPESIPASVPGRNEILTSLEGPTLLKRTATLADVGNAAVFAASDWARSMTSTEINISCGALVD